MPCGQMLSVVVFDGVASPFSSLLHLSRIGSPTRAVIGLPLASASWKNQSQWVAVLWQIGFDSILVGWTDASPC